MCFQARAGHHLIYPFNLLQLGERWISPKNYVNIVYPQPNSTHSLQKFILGKHYMVWIYSRERIDFIFISTSLSFLHPRPQFGGENENEGTQEGWDVCKQTNRTERKVKNLIWRQ